MSGKIVCTFVDNDGHPCGATAHTVATVRFANWIAAVWMCPDHTQFFEMQLPMLPAGMPQPMVVAHIQRFANIFVLSEMEDEDVHVPMFSCDKCHEPIGYNEDHWVHSIAGQHDHEAMPG